MALVMLTYVLWPGLRHQYNLHLRPQAFSMTHIRDLFKLGMPISLQMLFEVSAFSGATLIVGLIGAKALAAHQIALTITSVTYMAANGLAAALQHVSCQRAVYGRLWDHAGPATGLAAHLLYR
jgi:MATE family multidrug resistance protein